MIYCSRINVSEGIEINETNALEESDIFHY